MKNFFSIFSKHKSISLYTLSSVFLNIASLITGLVTYKYIEPYYIGLWQSLILIESYVIILRMGIINGMNRELPYVMGQGNTTLALKYAETTLFFTYINIATFIVFAGISLFFISISGNHILPLIAIFFIVCLNFYNSFTLATYRANTDFKKLSYIQILQAFLKILSILLVITWGFNGFVVREFGIILIITILAHIFQPFKKIKPLYDKKIFLNLFKVGFPIFVCGYFIIFINTAPRILLLKYGDIESIGIMAPLMTIITAISVIPDSISTYLYPKMTHAFGKTNDRLAIWRKTLYTHLGLIVLAFPIVIACIFLVPFFIDSFIPKYAESKTIISIGVFAALFMSYKFGFSSLITLKEWKLIVVYILFFAILQFLIPLWLMNFYSVLKAVVIGQIVSSAAMLIVSLVTNYIATHKTTV